MGKST